MVTTYSGERFPHGPVEYAAFDSGCWAPRIWRTPPWKEGPPIEDTPDFDAMINGLQQAEVLNDALERIFRVVHPSLETAATYGTEVRNLLILACTEVEEQWKAVLVANGASPMGQCLTTRDYVKLLAPMGLAAFGRALRRYPRYPEIWPFRDWDRERPTASLPWYDAYNQAKHDREGKFHEAKLCHAISAVAAIDVMLRAQFGRALLEAHQTTCAFRTLADKEWGETDGYHPAMPDEQWKRTPLSF